MDCIKSIIYIESIINCWEIQNYLSNKCDSLLPMQKIPLFNKIERMILLLVWLEIISKYKAIIL